MKNHIVSQLILKRFAAALNIYDLVTKKIDIHKKPNKVFYVNDRLSEDLDRYIGINVEQKFSTILDKKLLADDEIRLTREENLIVRKYLLMTSVRAFTEDDFASFINNFEKNADRILITLPHLKTLKRTKDLNLSSRELYELALRIYCESENLQNLMFDSRITLELFCWSIPFVSSYLTFWDAPNNQEFLLNECSMISEYETMRSIIKLDLSKQSYLLYRLNNSDDDIEKSFLMNLLGINEVMYENLNIFNLSSKRCMVLINPFYKLFFEKNLQYGFHKITNQIPIPDIWPSLFTNKLLFKIPDPCYRVSRLSLSMDDIFTFKPIILTTDETIYLNYLIINYTKEIIGFNDPHKVYDSICFYVWSYANKHSLDAQLAMSDDAVTKQFMLNLANNPFNKLLDLFTRLGIRFDSNYHEKLVNMDQIIINDLRTNKYIYHFLLSKENESRANNNLKMFGTPDERIIYFRRRYKELWGKDWDV